MKWSYWPAGQGFVQMYQLDEDDTPVERGRSGELYLCNYRRGCWAMSIASKGHREVAEFPLDMPEEELKAVAIATWRMDLT